jgi:hydroxymethylglutaryl-CoA reductase (NADPH)
MGVVNQNMTIGQKLDAFIEFFDSIPSVKIVIFTALVTVVFSQVLLNPKHGYSQKNDKLSKGSKPKNNFLIFLDYVVAVGFPVSIFAFISNASEYLASTTSLLKFFAVWSMFLFYFSSCFFMSFLDTKFLESLKKSKKIAPRAKTLNTPKERKSVHPPAKDIHPVCGVKGDSKPSQPVQLPDDIKSLSDEKVASLVVANKIKDHTLEKLFGPFRAVDIRRLAFESKLSTLGHSGALEELPSGPSLDYGRVFGANCEIVVGYVPLPVGVCGPITLNGESVYIPMATTEGCLVASTNRGCKAISAGSGATSVILRDGITRAPCLRMNSAKEAADLKLWCEEPENFMVLKEAFESTTSFGKLLSAEPTVSGKNVYLRLRCFSGDAMGMNMISKGSLAVVQVLRDLFPTLTLVALSGNMCTDKKAAATNWIEGRGKSVVIEATIPKDVVKKILKTDVKTIVSTNLQKNLIGSAMAGALGGFNAHAANNVTAIFLATGQDPAQNVESSNCITLLEETDDGDLWICCTMPSIEVGTVGGGTGLPAQSACLKMIGCKGGGETPGANAKQLAHVVAAGTMAGELSLLAALASNTLVSAHMEHNRKPAQKK